MVDMEFGQIIEKLIYFSGEKNYSLARELGYDVSYLSKWIRGVMLPASKNIKIICEKIAEFIVDNTGQSSRDDIIDYFSLDKENCDTEEALKQYLKDMIYQCYVFSRKNNDKKNTKEKNGKCNSVMISNPRFVKKYLDESIVKFTKGEKRGEVIVLSDLFSLARDDKLHMAGIRNKQQPKVDMNNVRIRFLISFNDSIDDVVFNIILFINMIRIYSNTDFTLYSYNHSKYSQIMVVKDKSFNQAVYTDTKECLFINSSEDKTVVDDMYHSLEKMVETKSKLTLLEKESKEMILEKIYMQYIMSEELQWLIGNMNELLMPSDLFFEVGKDVFGEDENIINELKNINAILQNAIYKSSLKVIIYEDAIKQYISTGELTFFNRRVRLTLDQRQRHLEYMENLFKKNENIELKLITDNLLDDFRNMENPSVFISKSLNFININEDKSINNKNKYCIVEDSKLNNIFRSFFKEIWNSEKDNITMTREDVICRLSDLLNYIIILRSTREL